MASVTIVSNRLPITVKKVGGRLNFYPSAGGLATGLASYTEDNHNNWVGWPGIVSDKLSDAEMEQISTELATKNCYPVFLTQKQVDDYLNGYSNSVLWPFFHNMPAEAKDQERMWTTYKQVNNLFAETVLGLSEPKSTIWVHDYQLLLLPEIIRAERPRSVTGFFLHIPFPSAESFGTLAHGKSLLKGMLGANLVGFHTYAYVQDFLDCCQLLGVGKPDEGKVLLTNRVVEVTDFPLGIDYTKFSRAGSDAQVQKYIRTHRKRYGRRRKVILTVDRLDPTKGLVERLEAYQELLQNNKRLHKKVVMVMLAIPSRTEIEAYKQLKTRVEDLVLSINLVYGTRRWQPVYYMYQTVPFEELAALYRVAHVAFIAPIKDGMNLVAKEYIASRPDKKGVLVLSETAGAAQELTDALLVNPISPKSLADGLMKALTMEHTELQQRAKDMRHHLATHSVHHWKKSFMETLQSPKLTKLAPVKHLNGRVLEQMLTTFAEAHKPSIVLDYDGVLAKIVAKPADAKPLKTTLKLLKKLATKLPGGVMIISGRSKQDLESWLGELPVALSAEHGAVTRSNKKWRKTVDLPSNWKRLILPVLKKYAELTPGAFVEEKDYSLVWHFRESPVYYAQKHLTIIKRTLTPLLKPMGLSMYTGKMILEIKSPFTNKGSTAHKWTKNSDFVLIIGDDYTDESMFESMPKNSYTVKVGRGKTLARYRVNNVEEVHKVLEKLANSKS